MAGQYSTRQFFRKAPNALLAQYFAARGQVLAIDVAALNQTDVEPIYDVWLGLTDEARGATEADFRDVQELANEAGIGTAISQALFEGIDLTDALAEMDDDYDRSFWVLLNYPQLFAIALRLQDSDRLSARMWRKRKELPKMPPRSDQATLRRVADGIVAHYRWSEARGHHCHVDYVGRGEKHYYFAFAEDYSRAEQDFEDGALQRRSHRPAFEIVFVYDPAEGALDTYAPGGATVRRKLEDVFADAVLDEVLGDGAVDERVYELDQLADSSFRFVFDPSAGIADVALRKLRGSLVQARGHRVTVEAPKHAELLERYARIVAVLGGDGATGVTQAEIKVTFADDGKRRPKTRTFTLTYPNGCSLGQDDRDGQLREMLIASGIDPSGIGRDQRRR